MTKDKEVSKWYAEKLGLDGDTEWLFDINDPACQIAIEDWIINQSGEVSHSGNPDDKVRYYYLCTLLTHKGAGGITRKEALIALWEAMKDE